ncbi:MAG: efflux RND transporter permease subunit [Planctomycetota bacterium]
MSHERPAFTSRVVETFLRGNLSPLLVLLSLVAGLAALLLTPREEEPQISVPVADVLVDVPGASAKEVERVVATRLEKLLYQIDGVEHLYSVSRPHHAVITVRFYVGEDREDSLVKLHNKLQMNTDRIPPQVRGWVAKPIEVDDVPIVAVTLSSNELDDYALRRVAEEIEQHLQAVPDTGRTRIIGGRPRKLRVLVDPEKLAGWSVTIGQLRRALRGASVSMPAGSLDRLDERVIVAADSVGASPEGLEVLVVGTHQGRPVYLRDVARVEDGPAERGSYSRIAFGAAAGDGVQEKLRNPRLDFPAVTIAVAKRKGSNAVSVSRDLEERIRELQQTVIPAGVQMRITRDHGQTANARVNELLEGLALAVIIVIALIALTLGWREGFVVATAVPITFALTLLVNYLAGYSINRVTLFALILALGLVVDDPIVDVENIYRHLRQGLRSPLDAVLHAVNEVRPPIILATLAVMVSFLPMFFITGMMGPYMAPMALNVPLAMFMSLIVAFTITPWLSHLLLRRRALRDRERGGVSQGELAGVETVYRVYGRIMQPLLTSRALRWGTVLFTALLFVFSGWLALGRHVPLKMLPFDNKDELQVLVDMPEGTTLERTEAVTAELSALLRGFPEVVDVTSHVGIASPTDFNGMVRQYYLRQGPHLADLRINLVPKSQRVAQSHEIALRFRRALESIALRYGANLKVVEPPPGPPVAATVTVEVYGSPELAYSELTRAAGLVGDRLRREAGVVEVDDTVETPSSKLRFVIDRDKASLHGIRDGDVARLLHASVSGDDVATIHAAREANPLRVEIRLPRELRSSVADLVQLPVSGAVGHSVRLGEIGRFVEATEEQSIYRKDLRRVAYVFAEVQGRAPAEVILDTQADFTQPGAPIPTASPVPLEDRSYLANGAGIPWSVPHGIELSWNGEGEWKITLDAFRDLGLAFLAACLGIYVLLVHETRSYLMPLILMLSIPFTVIGIMPGFWLLNALGAGEVAGVRNGTFFTATAMIGMIALSGIAVRNAILLIEFLRRQEAEGLPTAEALVLAGAVRLRPIFLTAGTAMLAAIPITLDPVFSGLAWALIFGLMVSSAFTLVLVPMLYYMAHGKRGAEISGSRDDRGSWASVQALLPQLPNPALSALQRQG